MKKHIIFLLAVLLVLVACSPMPNLDALMAAARDNPADPDSVTPVTVSWKVLGNPAVASGTGNYVTMAVDAGIPYVGFAGSAGPSAYKFISGTWNAVGNPITSTAITNFSFAVGGGTPYLVWADTIEDHAKQWSSGSWIDIGDFTPGILKGSINYVTLAMDGSTPYASFSTNAEGYVSRYSSSAWVLSSTSYTFTTGPTALSFAVSGGNLYNFYSNSPLTNRGSVSTSSLASWPTTAWSFIKDGTTNDFISPSTVISTSIIIVATKPVVAYEMASGITVKKYNAPNWNVVGAPDFAQGRLVKIAADAAGVLYIAYKDMVNGNKVTVKKYDGTAWLTVGTAGFSGAVGNYLSFAISQTDGTLYVAYDNADNTNQVQVMAYK